MHVRAVTKGQGPGICPGFYEHDHWLLSRKKVGKTEPKELPSGSINYSRSYSQNSTNDHLSTTSIFFLADSPYIDSCIFTASSLQRPLPSVPKVAIVERFNLNCTHQAKRSHVRLYCSLTRYLSVFLDKSGKCSSITKSTTFLKENKTNYYKSVAFKKQPLTLKARKAAGNLAVYSGSSNN